MPAINDMSPAGRVIFVLVMVRSVSRLAHVPLAMSVFVLAIPLQRVVIMPLAAMAL